MWYSVWGCWTCWSHSALNHLNPSTPLCISEPQWNMHKNNGAFLHILTESLPHGKNDPIIISPQVKNPGHLSPFSLSVSPSQPSTHPLLLPFLSLPFSYWMRSEYSRNKYSSGQALLPYPSLCALHRCPYQSRSCSVVVLVQQCFIHLFSQPTSICWEPTMV